MLRRYLALTHQVVSDRAPGLRRVLAMDFLREHANGIVSRGTLPPLKPPFWRFRSGSRLRIFNFTRRNPHNMDGVADHVGRAALAFGTSGNYAFFPVAAPCFWMKTLIFSRSEVAADAGLNPKHAFRKSKS
jgi:hypothetical protein